MSDADARARLTVADHAVLSTVDPERGVHAVPVCFAVVGERVVVPIDRVKPKSTTSLRRAENLAGDPRATLLADHWDRHDWHQLWWVRADVVRCDPSTIVDDERALLERALRDRYPQYREAVFADLLVFDVVGLTGWSATR